MLDIGLLTRDADPSLSIQEQKEEDKRLGLDETLYDEHNNVIPVKYDVTAYQESLKKICLGTDEIYQSFLTNVNYVYDMEKRFDGTRVVTGDEFLKEFVHLHQLREPDLLKINLLQYL